MQTAHFTTAALLAAAHAAAANPSVELVRGHADLAANVASNQPFLFFENDADVVFQNLTPDDDPTSIQDVYIRVPDSQITTRPDPADWDFLGTPPGNDIYFLPQSRNPAVPWLGLGAERLSPTVWSSVSLTVDAIDAPDDATFSLWQAPPLAVAISTAPGFSRSITFPAGAHTHYNWGFTHPGAYRLTITLTLTPVTGDPVSSTSDVWFAVGSDTVIPPDSIPGDTNDDGAVDFNDLLTVLDNFASSVNDGPTSGDLNNDNNVDFNDLLIVLDNFGNTAP
jgi:surface-anchored protein